MSFQFHQGPHALPTAPSGAFAAQNHLLATLPPGEFAAFAAELQPAYLARGTSICEPGSPLTHVYFPARGIVSLGYTAANGDAAEVAIVGREGVTCVEAFLGAEKASHRALAQTHCLAYRLSTRTARSTFAQGGPFYRAVLKYALDLMLQISHASVCNLHHSLEQRLCRALLQSADRLSSSTLLMTQEVLASLVNARRQGVSEAVQKLRDLGLITSGRGSIVVLDRAGLVAHACDCYHVVKGHRERLLAGT